MHDLRGKARLRTVEAERRALGRLTVRERRILDGIAAGKTNRQIAAELSLAEKTVKNHVSVILAKLGMSRRTQAAAFVARRADRVPGSGWG